ncbi:MAG TPA: (Fe-S)-binding protein [Planctomycetota bacterium]|nr:(Fe-S)-binding protein [Planctomycetota bacterium]
MRVSLFITCLADQLFPEVGVSMVRVLRRLGCDVNFAPEQSCCGQPHHNAGYAPEARRVARTLLDALDGAEHVVTPSGSCAAMVRHSYPTLFGEDSLEAARARSLASRTHEFSQFLVNVLGVEDVGATLERRVTYQPSCHATRFIGVKNEPLRLLGNVRGLELLPLANAQDCCGFGGLFCVKLPAISAAMAGEKVAHVAASRADVLVGTDMGCLMNIGGTLRANGTRIETLHLAQVLDSGHAGR